MALSGHPVASKVQMAPGSRTVDTGGEFHLPSCLTVVRRSRGGREATRKPHLTPLAPEHPLMSLHPRPDFAIPEETQRVAHAAFPKGTLCLRIADELGPLYRDDQFAELFSTRGQPADSPARL